MQLCAALLAVLLSVVHHVTQSILVSAIVWAVLFEVGVKQCSYYSHHQCACLSTNMAEEHSPEAHCSTAIHQRNTHPVTVLPGGCVAMHPGIPSTWFRYVHCRTASILLLIWHTLYNSWWMALQTPSAQTSGLGSVHLRSQSRTSDGCHMAAIAHRCNMNVPGGIMTCVAPHR